MNNVVDESCRLLAARYLRKQIKQLRGQLRGVCQADDLEYVHRARVASRRLRAGLAMFDDCFDGEPPKRWRKEIRRLTGSLGDARDTDVQIAFLTGALARIDREEFCPGIALVLSRLERRRGRLQPKVLAAVDRFETRGVGPEILLTTKRAVQRLEQEGVDVAAAAVFARAEETLSAGLEALLSLQVCLTDEEDQAGHHRMRITAKRLRYSLEICRPAYGERLDDFIAAAKQLQTLLGEIHDCDVWVEHLDKTLGRERDRIQTHYGQDAPVARLAVGIEHLRQERRQVRGQRFQQAAAYWEELRRAGTWQELIPTVRGHLEENPASQPPANTAAKKVEHKRASHWQRRPPADQTDQFDQTESLPDRPKTDPPRGRKAS